MTLSWNRNTEPDIAGYVVYWGTASRSEQDYDNSHTINDNLNDGSVISYEITGLEEGKTYYFAVKAFDTAGLYSDYSEEVSTTIPVSNNNGGSQVDEDGSSNDNSGREESNNNGNNADDNSSNNEAREQSFTKRINFQPSGVKVPGGYIADTGERFSLARGYGWLGSGRIYKFNHNSSKSPDELHDTVIYPYKSWKWEIVVPNGEYEVTYCLGSPKYRITNQVLLMEGNVVYSGSLNKGEWVERKVELTVRDGRLTLDFSRSRNWTAIDYIIINSIK